MPMVQMIPEYAAADCLGFREAELKQLRLAGQGPRFYRLPSGDIRYGEEDLMEWAMGDGPIFFGGRLEVADKTNLIPFPGITLVRKRPRLYPDREHTKRRRKRRQRRDPSGAA